MREYVRDRCDSDGAQDDKGGGHGATPQASKNLVRSNLGLSLAMMLHKRIANSRNDASVSFVAGICDALIAAAMAM